MYRKIEDRKKNLDLQAGIFGWHYRSLEKPDKGCLVSVEDGMNGIALSGQSNYDTDTDLQHSLRLHVCMFIRTNIIILSAGFSLRTI